MQQITKDPIWLLLMLFVAMKASVLGVPIFWDELLVYVKPALALGREGLWRVIPGFHSAEAFFGHPPGLAFLIGTFSVLFGESRWLFRGVLLAVSLVALYSTGRAARNVGGPAAGLMATAALAVYPSFYSHSTLLLGDTAAVGAVALAFLAFLEERWKIYAVSGTVAVLFKETALAFVVAALMGQLLLGGASRRSGFFLLVPVAAAGTFFLSNLLFYGRFSSFPLMQNVTMSPARVAANALSYSEFLFLYQGIGLVTVPAVVGGLYFLMRGKGLLCKTSLVALLSALFFLAGISFLDPVNSRYFLPALPPLVVVGVSVVVRALPWKAIQISLLLLYVLVMVWPSQKRPLIPGYSGEDTMEYLQIVNEQARALQYVETHFPNSQVAAVWPLSVMVRDPFYGYVSRELHWIDWAKNPPCGRFSVAVLSDASDLASSAKLEACLKARRFREVSDFSGSRGVRVLVESQL